MIDVNDKLLAILERWVLLHEMHTPGVMEYVIKRTNLLADTRETIAEAREAIDQTKPPEPDTL